MGKSTPPQPAAPDYAEANREAIYADIDTLPTRRKIEAAARLGERVEYADPETGQTKVADFTGFGDLQLTQQEMDAALDLIPTLSQAQLDNLTEFGPQFVKAQREQLRQMSPEEFDLREEFATRLRGGERTAEELASGLPSVPEYEEVDAPTLEDSGIQASMRADVEESIADRLALGEGLSAEQITAIEQDILGQAAKRGQTLSGGTALREILGKFRAGEELGRQRRAEAAGWLASGQGTADTQNRLAQQSFANAMGRVQQINQSRGATFAGQQQNIGTQIATRQQDISNIQSMLGLQTVAAQGGALSGLQQGAVPFAPPQIARGIGLDPNAAALGSQFAGNVFGTQAGMWGIERQQPSKAERVVSSISSLASGAGGAMKGAAAMSAACHVAREVYGNENPKWVEFFVWKETKGPRWFKALYNEYSEQWAKFISNKPRIKGIIRNWMDSKIKGE
jgi:hypothetical protein